MQNRPVASFLSADTKVMALNVQQQSTIQPFYSCGPCQHSWALQEQGLDTVDANRRLGLPDDCREYTSVQNILADLDIKSICLMVSFSGDSGSCEN